MGSQFSSDQGLDESQKVKSRNNDAKNYCEIVSDWNKVQDALTFLERFGDSSSLDPGFKDDVGTFKLMMKILIPLLECISKWKTEDLYSKYSPNTLACVLDHVIQEFVHISEIKDLKLYSTAAARIMASNLMELRTMEPEMVKLYSVVCQSSEPLLATGEATEVVSFINLLLENLNDMLCSKDDLIIFLKEQIEDLQNQLMFLRNFIGFLYEICIDHNILINLLTCAEARVVAAACLLFVILVEKNDDQDMAQKIKTELLELVEKIKPFSPSDVRRIYVDALEASRTMIIGPLVTDGYSFGFFYSLIHNLRELLNKRTCFELNPKESVENLLKKLSSLGCYIEETPYTSYKVGLENFRIELLDLIIDLGCFICSNNASEAQEKHSNLLDKIQYVENASGDLLIPRSWQYNFPETNELGFIDFILVNLREQLNIHTVSVDLPNCSFDTVYEELVALRHDFGEIAWLVKENVELRSLLTHYKDAVYQAEYLFDLSLSATEFSVSQRSGLTGLRESIRQIFSKLKAIKNITSDKLVHNIADSPHALSYEANPLTIAGAKHSEVGTRSHTYESTDQLVGLEDDTETIKEQLMRGSKQLKILSIVGMPGIGKTTLANLAYGDPSVTLHFHVRAWCSVSQVYQKESLLTEILHQVQRETPQDTESGLDQQVYQSLKGRRYLIILDDIWDTEVWEDLRSSFPNDCNGSRVIFTTRNHKVALRANSVPHALQLLSDEKSWKLLQVKVFNGETCPAGLLDIGKRIAVNCKGLPLAVVLIAGLLRTTERNQDCWGRVGHQLRSIVAAYRPGQQMGFLDLSYISLPDHLKPCFLYFGAFVEDEEIPVHKLVRLWIAEGFVNPPQVEQNSLEYEAQNYLNDLIDRSLVMIAKRSSRGGVKTCQVHDLIHEFCLVRGEQERFMLQISRHDDLPNFRISEMHEQYRLSIHSNSMHSVKMGHFDSRVRTLLFPKYSRMGHFDPQICNVSLTELREMSNLRFRLSGSRRRCHQHLSGVYVIAKFQLLRLLDLGAAHIVFEEDFSTIARLVYLRYLAIQAYTRRIPAEIASLKNLETFLLSTATLESAVLAVTILSMVRLRHLHIGKDSISSFNFQIDNPNSLDVYPKTENLSSLSTPRLSCDNDIEKIMLKFPNLQKLKCRFLDSWDDSEGCNKFPVLDFLNRLESLKVFFSGMGLYPCNLSFPSSLKKLALTKCCLPWHEISIIGRLPNLEVLKLLREAFKGSEWIMKDEEFQKLKFLKLVSLDIQIWKASSEHLPHLEQLVLDYCHGLEEIPSALGDISTLRRIDMKFCSSIAAGFVKQIESEQHEMGNDQFNAFISES